MKKYLEEVSPEDNNVMEDAGERKTIESEVKFTIERNEIRNRPLYIMPTRYTLAKKPAWYCEPPEVIRHYYGATDFVSCVRKYIAETYPYAKYLPTENDGFHIFKRLYIKLDPLNGVEDKDRKDVVRATPSRSNKGDRNKFDTVLVHESASAETVGIEGKRMK